MPNLAQISTGTKVLLGAGLLLLIDLFLSWQQACTPNVAGVQFCGSVSGWSGIGVLTGLLVIALLAWEVAHLTNILANVALPIAPSLISIGLAAAVVLFGVIEFLTHGTARHWPAWLGLILCIAIAVAAWLKFNEAGATTTAAPQAPAPPPPPPPA